MSKIAFLISSLRPGGAEKVCVSLINEFYERGYEVCIIVLNLKGKQLSKFLNGNIPIYNLRVNRAMTSFFPLRRILKELDVKTCLSFNFQLSVQLILIRRTSNLKFLVFSRGINTFSKKISNENSLRYRFFNALVIKWLYKKSDYFVAQSTGMKDDMISSLKVDPRKIKVIFNPANVLNDFQNKTKIEMEHNTLKEILFVGSLKQQKNLPFLLSCIKNLSQIKKDIIFRIVGDGPLSQPLKSAVNELGIQQFVSFEGFSDSPTEYYKKADLFILGSWYEGFPNVLVEALSYGVPVVSVDCMSGPADIIVQGVNGFLVANYNVDEFVSKIMSALTKKWDRNAIIDSVKRFDFSNIFDRYEEFLIHGK